MGHHPWVRSPISLFILAPQFTFTAFWNVEIEARYDGVSTHFKNISQIGSSDPTGVIIFETTTLSF